MQFLLMFQWSRKLSLMQLSKFKSIFRLLKPRLASHFRFWWHERTLEEISLERRVKAFHRVQNLTNWLEIFALYLQRQVFYFICQWVDNLPDDENYDIDWKKNSNHTKQLTVPDDNLKENNSEKIAFRDLSKWRLPSSCIYLSIYMSIYISIFLLILTSVVYCWSRSFVCLCFMPASLFVFFSVFLLTTTRRNISNL